jgi:hypothetical protein
MQYAGPELTVAEGISASIVSVPGVFFSDIAMTAPMPGRTINAVVLSCGLFSVRHAQKNRRAVTA